MKTRSMIRDDYSGFSERIATKQPTNVKVSRRRKKNKMAKKMRKLNRKK